jgi:iron complex outermembrane receptor protein
MSFARTRLMVRRGSPVAQAMAAILAVSATTPVWAAEQGLEEIVVTAQRRETSLQTTPIAISAYSGSNLADAKVFNAQDLANAVPSFSLTAGSPLDQELNIRGITNTRLDSPTSDPSVGTFVDGVYIGRTGDYNFDFYDLERVEVIRGPQGVLLGKNVVGGALSIITMSPSQQESSEITVGLGNYSSKLFTGHVNGGITDTLSGRLSFQYRTHDGYAEDVLHHRDVENLDSTQMRGQLLWEPGDGWKIRGIVDYTDDRNNGINVVAVAGGIKNCETTYLGGPKGNCTRPWSLVREYLGMTDPRQNMAQSVQFKDHSRIQQYMERVGHGATLDIQKVWSGVTFNSLTGYRNTDSGQLYDQTGIGPEALNWNVAQWQNFYNWTDTKYGPTGAPCPAFPSTPSCWARTYNNGRFLFAQPVNEVVSADSFSQEFRLASNGDGRFDWLIGAYYQHDNVDKNDRFIGENFLGTIFPGGNNPLSTLSGQNNWYNKGEMTNYAGFGQLGFKFTDTLKLSAGLRYTSDKKEGNVKGVVVATGDRFSPNDPRANVTIESICRRPDGTPVKTATGGYGVAVCAAPNRWIYSAGEGFQANYSHSWSEVTPQATLDWKITPDFYTYLTYSEGFKGGGYDDTPANIPQATTPFNPEKAKNYELGFKSTMWDRRVRLNADIFYMDYTDLQVTQTNASCLCNITDNAASAEIKGVEGEFEFLPIDSLRISIAGSYVDATYKDFLESAIVPSTGLQLDSSGNRLQRTPETQLSGGIDWKLGMADFNVNYTWQSDMFWATDNIAKEPAYGLLDARVGFGPEDKSWQLAVWGKNLTDELYRTNIIPFFGEEVSQFGPPRTYGLDVTLRF